MRKPCSRQRVHQVCSPVLSLQRRLPAWRSRFVVLLFFLGFGGLLGRAVWVQLVDGRFYAEEGRKRFERILTIPAARGDILDRDGRLLAVSLPMRTIYWLGSTKTAAELNSDANGTGTPPLAADTLGALAALLEMPVAQLRARIDTKRSLVYLKRRVSIERAARIEALGIPEIRSVIEWQRYYPDGEASAQVVGFADIDERGQEGIEASQDARLRPRPGRRIVVRNRMGTVVDDELLESPAPGEAVRLTLDSRMQHAAFSAVARAAQAHHATSGGAIILDARNGDILALVNWPSFDPIDRSLEKDDRSFNRTGPSLQRNVCSWR